MNMFTMSHLYEELSLSLYLESEETLFVLHTDISERSSQCISFYMMILI